MLLRLRLVSALRIVIANSTVKAPFEWEATARRTHITSRRSYLPFTRNARAFDPFVYGSIRVRSFCQCRLFDQLSQEFSCLSVGLCNLHILFHGFGHLKASDRCLRSTNGLPDIGIIATFEFPQAN